MTTPLCKAVYPWLRSNLGKRCLAPLTSGDAYALAAAVHIVELWGSCQKNSIASAFGAVVMEMQPSTRYLAFHSIAHVLDWSHRAELWHAAQLPALQYPTCSFEPGGPCIDLAKGGAK